MMSFPLEAIVGISLSANYIGYGKRNKNNMLVIFVTLTGYNFVSQMKLFQKLFSCDMLSILNEMFNFGE